MQNLRRQILLSITLCLLTLFGIITTVEACSVPVFRYALERWPADPYYLTVFYNAELNKDQKEVVKYLTSYEEDKRNIYIDQIDVSKEIPNRFSEIWEKHKKDKLPIMILNYPSETGLPNEVASVPLEMQEAKFMMESPVRRELARRIIKGDSAVWLQIDCDDQKKNLETEKRINVILKNMEAELKLPHEELEENEELDESSMEYDKGMKIKFSLLRFSPENPNEKYLIKMLFSVGEKLPNTKEPILVPIYGRARALVLLDNKDVNEELLFDIASFLTGACSCEVKARNPGLDLLVSVVWDDFIDNTINLNQELPPLTGIAAFSEKKADNKKLDKKVDLKSALKIEKNDSNELLLNITLAMVGLIILVSLISILKTKKNNSK